MKLTERKELLYMKSIQSRLFFMLLAFIILPYFLSVLIIYGYTKESVEQHELQNSKEQIDKLSIELDQYFNDMINLPYILYRNPDFFRIFTNGYEDSIYFNSIAMEENIETFFLMRSEIRQIRFYLDKNKESFTIYNGMISARKPQIQLMKQESMQELLHLNSHYLIEPPHSIGNYNNAAIIPESDKTTVMTIHHKILDPLSKEFLGIITIDIDLDEYAQICNSLLQEKGDSIFLLNERDVVMYTNNTSLIGKTTDQNFFNTNQNKKNDIILTKTLSEPFHQWKIVKVTPSDRLFYEARQTAYTNILVGIGVGLLGLIMIGILAYYISRPIKNLSQKVLSIKGGNLSVPFNNNREDEIGHLEKHMKEMLERINLHIDREYKLEIENRKNQLRALKSQVNPHFLFNALQSIGAVALQYNSPKIYQLVTSLSKMMRYSIRADQWVLVREEMDYIKAYLTLQRERFGSKLKYSININEVIQEIKIPSMILQPLVENYFKHCYEQGYFDSQLNITGEIKEDFLYLIVENDYSSLSAEELERLNNNIYCAPYPGDFSHEHIGLKNIHDRLLLNYEAKAGLEIDTNNGQGFIVKIYIQMQN